MLYLKSFSFGGEVLKYLDPTIKPKNVSLFPTRQPENPPVETLFNKI